MTPPPNQTTRSDASGGRRVDPDVVLGTVLRRARLVAGLTCEQAAAMSGLGYGQVAAAEDGDSALAFVDALPLARAYRQSLTELAHCFERELTAAGEV